MVQTYRNQKQYEETVPNNMEQYLIKGVEPSSDPLVLNRCAFHHYASMGMECV